MKYDAEVSRAIAHWGPTYGVAIPPALVHAIIERESGHGRSLVTVEPGNHRSYGPMMVLDTTATSVFHLADPTALVDPGLGIWYGVGYLAQQLKRFPGSPTRAISAYNAGAGNAHLTASGTYPNQPYVNKVLALLKQYRGAAAVAVPTAILLVGGLLLLSARRRAA